MGFNKCGGGLKNGSENGIFNNSYDFKYADTGGLRNACST
jgi:hypothetical protein